MEMHLIWKSALTKTLRCNAETMEEIDVFEIACSDGNAILWNSNHSRDEKPNAKLKNLSAYPETDEASGMGSYSYFPGDESSSENRRSKKQCNRKGKIKTKCRKKKQRKNNCSKGKFR